MELPDHHLDELERVFALTVKLRPHSASWNGLQEQAAEEELIAQSGAAMNHYSLHKPQEVSRLA